MIRLRHARARQHLREHAEQVHLGVLRLCQGLTLEAAEEAAQAIPGRPLDGVARRRVTAALDRRTEDLLEFLRHLAADETHAPPTPKRRTVTPETQSFLTTAGIVAALLYGAQYLLGGGWAKVQSWLAARPTSPANGRPQVIPAAYH